MNKVSLFFSYNIIERINFYNNIVGMINYYFIFLLDTPQHHNSNLTMDSHHWALQGV